jgi:hypothetical protein
MSGKEQRAELDRHAEHQLRELIFRVRAGSTVDIIDLETALQLEEWLASPSPANEQAGHSPAATPASDAIHAMADEFAVNYLTSAATSAPAPQGAENENHPSDCGNRESAISDLWTLPAAIRLREIIHQVERENHFCVDPKERNLLITALLKAPALPPRDEEPIPFPEPSPYSRSDKMKEIVALLDANQESLFKMIRDAEKCAYEWMVRYDRALAASRREKG